MDDKSTRWVKVWETPLEWEAHVLAARLRKEGIPCQVVDKKDSVYVMIGHVELYVPSSVHLEARKLLRSWKTAEQ